MFQVSLRLLPQLLHRQPQPLHHLLPLHQLLPLLLLNHSQQLLSPLQPTSNHLLHMARHLIPACRTLLNPTCTLLHLYQQASTLMAMAEPSTKILQLHILSSSNQVSNQLQASLLTHSNQAKPLILSSISSHHHKAIRIHPKATLDIPLSSHSYQQSG